MDVRKQKQGEGDVKAGLEAMCAGNRRINCDERREAGGGPMTVVVRVGDS